ncbi:6-phospho-3-hexuloisomerase, partial [Streptococcus sp. KR]
LGDAVIVVPGATKAGDGVKSIQLLSTLFDQSVHITLDVLCLKLSRRDHVSNDAAKAEHSNME